MDDLGPFEHFICGGVGGICTILVGHPFDTIKVRLQTMPVPKPGEAALYKGTYDCVKKLMVNEGFKGFYKGMGAPLVGVAPIFALSFMSYKLGKQLFAGWFDPKGRFTRLNCLVAGGFSAIFATTILAPGERIKCLLQIQQDAKTKIYDGPVDCIRKLYKQGGIRSIYKGSAATLLRDVPASGFYFLTYETMRDYLTDHGREDVTVLGTIFAGGCSGISNWLVGMPFDVLKSRLQTVGETQFSKGLRDVAWELLKKEGPLALYKGIVPVLMRAFPANGACFLGFELCKGLLKNSTFVKASENDSVKYNVP